MWLRLTWVLLLPCTVVLPTGGRQAAAGAPTTRPAPSAAQPAVAEAPAAEYRFDALRFDGRVTGAQSLVAFARRLLPRAPLHALRVDFSARIFETIEAEALH